MLFAASPPSVKIYRCDVDGEEQRQWPAGYYMQPERDLARIDTTYPHGGDRRQPVFKRDDPAADPARQQCREEGGEQCEIEVLAKPQSGVPDERGERQRTNGDMRQPPDSEVAKLEGLPTLAPREVGRGWGREKVRKAVWIMGEAV